MEERLYKVCEKNMDKLRGKLADLNKKARKLGSGKISMEVVNTEDIVGEDGWVDRYHEIRVIGEAPMLNGWEFIATITHKDAGILIRAIPGLEYPDRFSNIGTICEHCNTSRLRKDTYIVHHVETNEYKTVGKSCLKDFLGHAHPGRYANMAEWFADDEWLVELANVGNSNNSRRICLVTYLAYTSMAIRTIGWRSKATADEYGSVATAYEAIDLMFPGIRRSILHYIEDDLELAKSAIEWAKTNLNSRNEYLRNIAIIAHEIGIEYRETGLAASIVASYQKEIGRIKEREIRQEREAGSEHFGVIGKRTDFILTVLDVRFFESMFGMVTFHRMIDGSGNIAIWKSSSSTLEVGKTYNIRGDSKGS